MVDASIAAAGQTNRKVLQGSTTDYSRIASRYDATRELPDEHLNTCYDRRIEQGVLPVDGEILDAGCGTGQVSLPLAARGYRVRGFDVSKEMTMLAQAKVRAPWQADYAVADVRSIPTADNSFDAAVVSKLFQHIQDWREACRELIRVVGPGCCVVQINERGAFGNAVRRFFSHRADQLGFSDRYPGLNPRSGTELAAFMASQGCQSVPVDMSDLRWDTAISYGEALSRIREGLSSEFWRLPSGIFDQIAADTLAWIEAQPNGQDTIENLRPYLVVEVFRTPSP